MEFSRLFKSVEDKLPDEDLFVEDYMTKEVVTVTPDDTIHSAVDLMIRHNIHGLVVVEDGRPVGVLSTFDLLLVIALKDFDGDKPVKKIMVAPPITVEKHTTVQKALKIMLANNIQRLPVVEDGRLAGNLSLVDLASALI